MDKSQIDRDIKIFKEVFTDSIWLDPKPMKAYIDNHEIDYDYFLFLSNCGIIDIIYFADTDNMMIYKLSSKDLDKKIYDAYSDPTHVEFTNITDPILHIYREKKINEII